MSARTLVLMMTLLLGVGLATLPALALDFKAAPEPTATETPSQPGECDCHYALRLVFYCAGQFSVGDSSIRLSFIAGEAPESGCEPVTCEDAFAQCTLSSQVTVAKSADPCEVIPGMLVSQLTECLEGYEKGSICVYPDLKDSGGIFLESSEPFHICLCSDELGLSCQEDMGLLVQNCPVYNLFDGIDGNEIHDWREFQAGIGIEVTQAVCPDVDPTETPTNTTPVENTPTFTPTATFTTPAENTPTFTPTATFTNPPENTPTPTPTQGDCVCEYAAHLIINCTGQIQVSDEPFVLKLGLGAYENNDCEPVLCEQGLIECTLTTALIQAKSADLCDIIPDQLISQILSCIEAQGNGVICVVRDEKYAGGLYIQSSEPFHLCLCSAEMGLPCIESVGQILGGCPVYNLSDGTQGNETHDYTQFKSGLGIELEPVTCVEYEEARVRESSGQVEKTSSVENWRFNK